MYPQRPMIKQVRMGEKRGCEGVSFNRKIKTFFSSQNSRNSDRSKGLQLLPSFTVKV